MKIRVFYTAFIFCLVLIILYLTFSQPHNLKTNIWHSEDLFPAEYKGKQVYMDRIGKIVFKTNFDAVLDFSEDLAIVQKVDGNSYKAGFIDKTGNIAIPLQYDSDSVLPFKEGYALVRQKGKYYFIDRLGNKVSDSYDKVSAYDRGMSWGVINEDEYDLRWGGYRINKSLDKKIYGDEIEGMTITTDKVQWGFINQELEQVIPEIFSSARNFSEGLAAVETNAKWGYINREGKFVIPPRFDGAKDFKAGIAPIKIDEKWGYINMFGEVVIKPIFVEASKFENGLAKVRGDNDSFFYINLSGKRIIPFEK